MCDGNANSLTAVWIGASVLQYKQYDASGLSHALQYESFGIHAWRYELRSERCLIARSGAAITMLAPAEPSLRSTNIPIGG
jgi:hypothetical protein